MIHSLYLQNFQSHKETILELHSGVNVIIGSSDSGKSAIIRGINWIAKNRPSGDSYRSIWGGHTECRVEAPNGLIGHFRGDSEAGYTVNKTKLRAVGTEVPEEVQELLQFDDELNIQYQHDSPFGLSFTSGEMAKLLNRIVKIDSIDTALTTISGMGRKEKSLEEQTSESIKTKEKKLLQYQTVEDDLKTAEEILNLCDKVAKLKSMHQDISSVVEEVSRCEKILQSIPSVKNIDKEMEDISKRIKEHKYLKEKGDALATLLDDIEEVSMECSHLHIELSKYESAFIKTMPPICPLCGQAVHKGKHDE